MRYFKTALIAAIVASFAIPASADRLSRRQGNSPEIEVWTNKGYDATYYYGEDIAVYFRAEQDCYVVVYDIDPSGEVTILFPSNYYNSAYVNGGEVYRIPDHYSDYSLEVSGQSGTEHIFAVASNEYLDPPDFMRYIGYDYGDPEHYDNDYFVTYMRGDLDDFIDFVNDRIARGPYSVDHARFYVDSAYRHHRQYRYWDYNPYYVGSVWVGSNFPGSEVWIDGIYYGIAPILIPRIYIGQHWLWLYYGGFPCYQRYFYVSSVQRYYIDARIDDGYRDYRHRRRAFGGWRPLEKKYRNEDGFKEKAIRARSDKRVRTRALPTHVVRDFDKRGIISAEAPMVKKARAEYRRDDRDRRLEKRRTERGLERRDSVRDRTRSEKKGPNVSASDKRSEDIKGRPIKKSDSRYKSKERGKSLKDIDRKTTVTKKAKDKGKKSSSVKSNDSKQSKSSGIRKSQGSSKKSTAKSSAKSSKKSSGKERRR